MQIFFLGPVDFPILLVLSFGETLRFVFVLRKITKRFYILAGNALEKLFLADFKENDLSNLKIQIFSTSRIG